jgi:hypothetical protein
VDWIKMESEEPAEASLLRRQPSRTLPLQCGVQLRHQPHAHLVDAAVIAPLERSTALF